MLIRGHCPLFFYHLYERLFYKWKYPDDEHLSFLWWQALLKADHYSAYNNKEKNKCQHLVF